MAAMTVKHLKELLATWPETSPVTGEPTKVLIRHDHRWAVPCIDVAELSNRDLLIDIDDTDVSMIKED